jgi:hypothetical protein
MWSVTKIDVLTVAIIAIDELPGTRVKDRVTGVVISLYILLVIVLFLKTST